jgi:hypothetical protein
MHANETNDSQPADAAGVHPAAIDVHNHFAQSQFPSFSLLKSSPAQPFHTFPLHLTQNTTAPVSST